MSKCAGTKTWMKLLQWFTNYHLSHIHKIYYRNYQAASFPYADPNQKHDNGDLRNYTPLMLAAELNFVEAFKMMVESGGDPNQKCNSPTRFWLQNRCFLLEIARQWKADGIIHFLKKIGIVFPANIKNEGNLYLNYTRIDRSDL